MYLSFIDQLQLKKEASSLSKQARDKTLAFDARLEIKKQYRSIIATLKGAKATLNEMPQEIIYAKSLVLGQQVLDDHKVPEISQAKSQISNTIRNSPSVQRAIELNGWGSDETKAEILEKAATLTLSEAYNESLIDHRLYDELVSLHHRERERIGKPIIEAVNSMIANSPMSKAKADKMAADMPITPNCEKKLTSQRKGDYRGKKKAISLLRSDVSDFHRLTNGASKVWMFTYEPSVRNIGRAHYNFMSKAVHIGDSLTKPVLWHELIHSLDFDYPWILNATKGFLEERLQQARKTRGKGFARLKDIYPGAMYNPNEVTIWDHAIDHYVTKVYIPAGQPIKVQNTTNGEVLSMGIQMLANPEDAGRLAVEDPDHLKFTLGILARLQQGES